MKCDKLNYIVNNSSYTPVGNLKDVVSNLPAAVFEIRDVPFAGTQLFIRDNIDTSVPKKVYGKLPVNLEKAFRAFDRRPLNTGILLSGERGMGKTMFARMAINEAIRRGIAVITLTNSVKLDNAITLINRITQPLVIVMDEFEKNFSTADSKDDDDDDETSSTSGTQTKFLSMLDGMGSSEKRMFIATVNSTQSLNKFMLNRPGRFYYHFEFNTLSPSEMEDYLNHECRKSVSRKDIKFAVSIMQSYSINYDGIAAIADELNSGMGVEETLRDLNLDREGTNGTTLRIKINEFIYEADQQNWSLTEFRTSGFWSRALDCVNPPRLSDEDETGKVVTRTGFLGNTIEVNFVGNKIAMEPNGKVVVPVKDIQSIVLQNGYHMVHNGKDLYTVKPSMFSKIEPLEFIPITHDYRALYLNYLDA